MEGSENRQSPTKLTRWVPAVLVAGLTLFHAINNWIWLVAAWVALKMLHEIGHGLGLKHGHETSGPSALLQKAAVAAINGIALGVLELKSSTVSVSKGIRQNRRNQRRDFIQPFFATVQLVMAGNDTEGLRCQRRGQSIRDVVGTAHAQLGGFEERFTVEHQNATVERPVRRSASMVMATHATVQQVSMAPGAYEAIFVGVAHDDAVVAEMARVGKTLEDARQGGQDQHSDSAAVEPLDAACAGTEGP